MNQKITRYLICITILLLPAYLIKLAIFCIPTNVLELLILLTFLSYLIKGRYSPFEFYRKHKSLAWAVAAIFAGLLISTLINHNYQSGLGIIKSWFIVPLIFAWVVFDEVKSEGNAKSLLKWLYLSTFWVAITSLAYYFTGWITYDGRLQGIFNSPNYLAMYLAPGIIIAFSQIQSTSWRGKNKTYFFGSAASLAVILISFYLTYSYAAWTAVAASLLAMEFVKSKKKFNFRKITVIVAVIILIISSQWNSQKFQGLRATSERSSLESRSMIWSAAIKILGDNIFFGIGPGNFQNKYLEYQKYFPPYLEWAAPHPHNLYLAFWLYGGMLSFTGFIVLIIFWFKEVLKKEKDDLWLASFGIMLYFLLHGLVDTTYFKNDLAVVFWLNFILLL